MILLLPLYLKDMLFIALFSNIYRGEHIYDNHLVLKFIPTIKTKKCLLTWVHNRDRAKIMENAYKNATQLYHLTNLYNC